MWSPRSDQSDFLPLYRTPRGSLQRRLYGGVWPHYWKSILAELLEYRPVKEVLCMRIMTHSQVFRPKFTPIRRFLASKTHPFCPHIPSLTQYGSAPVGYRHCKFCFHSCSNVPVSVCWGKDSCLRAYSPSGDNSSRSFTTSFDSRNYDNWMQLV